MFKDSFKYYKSKIAPPCLTDVVDIEQVEKCEALGVCEVNPFHKDYVLNHRPQPYGLLPPSEWHFYELTKHPGLLLIRNPFTIQGQRYWMARCLRDYTKAPPSNVNLNANLFSSDVLSNWWQALQIESNGDKNEFRRIRLSMRWATLGYHHNWDTKVYDTTKQTGFPKDLSVLCDYFANVLSLEKFTAEAAIVNFYPIGTTLAGHTDHSELNHEAPLFSFSFGQSAIFLIGGKTKEEKPTAVYLRSGDVMVMAGDSRLCYHAVPRVMKEKRAEIWNEVINGMDIKSAILTPKPKKMRIESELPEVEVLDPVCFMDMNLYNQVADEQFWLPFKIYLNDARININVRQVHVTANPNIETSDAFS